jgi:hypothetical protein
MEIRRTSALPASTIQDNFKNLINFKTKDSHLGGKIRHASAIDMQRTLDTTSINN